MEKQIFLRYPVPLYISPAAALFQSFTYLRRRFCRIPDTLGLVLVVSKAYSS